MSTAPKLISIVLPTYNGSKYIRESINSCLNQTYGHFELIIVNDCSTDETLAIVTEYAKSDARVRVVSNSKNQNLPRSLNIGFEQAVGDYFCWTSDDNWFAPEALYKLVTELEQSGSDVVYSSYGIMDEDGRLVSTYSQPIEGLLFGCVTGPCFLYKREVHFHLGGYNHQMFRAEDMDFWMRAVVRFQFRHLDNSALYKYRLHQSSLSTQIYTDQQNYSDHKRNYATIFRQFFSEGLQLYLTDEQLSDYIDLFFFDKELFALKQKSNVSQIITRYLELFDVLKSAAWQRVNFSPEAVFLLLDKKREMVVQSVIDNVLLENTLLKKENPRIARNFSNNIAWYYKEYEVLPRWYKKLGHVIKILQGNKRVKRLGKKEHVS